MTNYDKLTREEMVKLCQALWLKNTDLERNIELYRGQLKNVRNIKILMNGII